MLITFWTAVPLLVSDCRCFCQSQTSTGTAVQNVMSIMLGLAAAHGDGPSSSVLLRSASPRSDDVCCRAK